MKVKEVAPLINAHLKRIEADPKLNPETFYKSARTGKRESAGRQFYSAGAYASGGWVRIKYVIYQGATNLRAPEAERYLVWLDAGNVGTHWKEQRPQG
jgi:hypothetical protein